MSISVSCVGEKESGFVSVNIKVIMFSLLTLLVSEWFLLHTIRWSDYFKILAVKNLFLIFTAKRIFLTGIEKEIVKWMFLLDIKFKCCAVKWNNLSWMFFTVQNPQESRLLTIEPTPFLFCSRAEGWRQWNGRFQNHFQEKDFFFFWQRYVGYLTRKIPHQICQLNSPVILIRACGITRTGSFNI